MPEGVFRLAFLADTQLGMYATFSGMTEADVARYAAMGMRVEAVPRVEGFEWDARRYERAVTLLNRLRPDLVVIGGDMIDDSNHEDQIEAFLEITSRLDPDLTMHYAPGNHDIAPDTVVPTDESVATYREVFGPNHYVLTAGPASFLILDTVVIDHPELAPRAWEEQQDFLEDVLGTPPPAPLVVVGHHPLFLDHPDEPDTYWNLPRERRRPLYDRLRRAGVTLAFAGHWHRNNVAVHDGFEMVTSGPVGYPLGSDPSGLRIVDITENHISHRYLSLEE
jgi:3',5'-cyclic AMP phosphodiesterase CpdA